MRRRAALTAVTCTLATWAIAPVAHARDPGRQGLDLVRPRSFEITNSSITAELEVLTDSSGAKTGISLWHIGVSVGNQTKKPLWVRVDFLDAGPAERGETRQIERRHQLDFSCPLDTVVAGREYLIDVTTYADGPKAAPLEHIETRLRFAQAEVDAGIHHLRNQRHKLAGGPPPRFSLLQNLIDSFNPAIKPPPPDDGTLPASRTTSAVFRRTGFFGELNGGFGVIALESDSLDHIQVGGVPASLGVGAYLCPWLTLGVRFETMIGISADFLILPVSGFAGADIELWPSSRWMIGAGIGPAVSVASNETSLGVPIRVGYCPPGLGADIPGVIQLEYFPILHREGTAWTIGVVASTHGRGHRYKPTKKP